MGSRILVVVIAAFGATAVPAHAQGLLGTTRSDARGSSLNVTFGTNVAYDAELPPELRSSLPRNDSQWGGFSSMLSASAAYARGGRRGQLTGSGQTAFRYSRQLGEVTPVSHSGAIGASLNLSRTASLQVNQTVAYSPPYLYQLFPGATPPALGEAPAAAPEYRVHQNDSSTYGTNVTLGVGSPRGHRWSASADYGHTNFQGQALDQRNLTTYGVGATYSKGLGRSASLSAGYSFRTGEFQFGAAQTHQVDLGAEYSRALSSTRRATFRVSVGPTFVDLPESNPNALAMGRAHRLQAAAGVDVLLHRAWQVGTSYRRNTEYVPGLLEPVFTDAVGAQVSGVITRRFAVSASAGYVRGGSVVTPDDRPMGSYTALTRVQFAATRRLDVYSEYVYYIYDLREQSALAPGLPPRYEQSGVRAGLTLSLPLF